MVMAGSRHPIQPRAPRPSVTRPRGSAPTISTHSEAIEQGYALTESEAGDSERERVHVSKHMQLSLPSQDGRTTPEPAEFLEAFSLSPDKKKKGQRQ